VDREPQRLMTAYRPPSLTAEQQLRQRAAESHQVASKLSAFLFAQVADCDLKLDGYLSRDAKVSVRARRAAFTEAMDELWRLRGFGGESAHGNGSGGAQGKPAVEGSQIGGSGPGEQTGVAVG
jgi:hypothetical protein